MRSIFVIAVSAAAFGALTVSANVSTPFGMAGAQTHRIEPVAEVCRKLCGESVCRLQCFNTRDDNDVTVGTGGEVGVSAVLTSTGTVIVIGIRLGIDSANLG
jgi:hypothetical protein